ncbi:MAG: uroporphyrinogen decarboxylase [Magnetococcales bacterium]|nr:uroporphyrinogen decarboxylase [Magnetococcales bacterium]
MQPTHSFLRAALRLQTESTPIWIMRQAGRYLPEYRKVRARAGDFLSLCKNPDLATEVTLQPLRRFDLDAAILFSDILVIPEAMGMNLRFLEGEGPLLEPALRSTLDLDLLHPIDPESHLDYVMKAVTSIRRELDGRVPLIGFSGSPWTLATYMVEGGSSKNFTFIKRMMYSDPKSMHRLLNLLSDCVADYLNAQIQNGVQAVQIFDTWGGVLSPRDFLEFSLRPMQNILERLKTIGPDGQQIPVILFAKGCAAHLETMAATACQVLGLDWMTDLGQARDRVGSRVALQGNMDPAILHAPPERIQQEVRDLLASFGPAPGHIFNLGHGITPDVSPEKVAILVESVHNESQRLRQERS